MSDDLPATRDNAAIEADVAAVFGFDTPSAASPEAPATPAEPAATPAKPGEGTEAPAPSPATPPAPAAPAPATPPVAPMPPLAAPSVTPAAPPATPMPPAAPADDALKMASLQAQVEALQAQLAARDKPPVPGSTPSATPSATPGTASTGSDQQSQEVRYGLSLPQEVQAALLSEKPEDTVAAITHICNSLATHVHTKVRAEYQAAIAELRGNLQTQEREAEIEDFRTRAMEEYFGAFPDHKDPIIRPLIQQTAAQLATEFPQLPWDANYIAALGARVNAAVDKLRGGATTPTPTPPAPTPPAPPAKPAAMLPASRSGIPDFEQDRGELIADTFSWG